LDKKSESLLLIQRIRDEAHRFAITFHRQVRSKKALGTQLTEIEGIGTQTAQKLLKEFKSVRKILLASEEEVAAVIGAAKAKALLEGLAKNKAPN
jgi:excinuclease ABC subunit C